MAMAARKGQRLRGDIQKNYMTPDPIYVNLGCGNRYHKDWLNLDSSVADPALVKHADLRHGIPLASESCNVVYHSHFIEHLTKTQALSFTKECYRVLKPNGIIRVATPNLEEIVKQYLHYLQLAAEGDKLAEATYDWMVIEMYDQCVRNRGGGEMMKYLAQPILQNEQFLKERIGPTMLNMLRNYHSSIDKQKSEAQTLSLSSLKINFLNKWKALKYKASMLVPGALNRKIGRFRLSGETHQWMYDRFSLSRLLLQCSFVSSTVCQADQGAIPDWKSYNLDTEVDGTVYKPDSFFMEARKH